MIVVVAAYKDNGNTLRSKISLRSDVTDAEFLLDGAGAGAGAAVDLMNYLFPFNSPGTQRRRRAKGEGRQAIVRSLYIQDSPVG